MLRFCCRCTFVPSPLYIYFNVFNFISFIHVHKNILHFIITHSHYKKHFFNIKTLSYFYQSTNFYTQHNISLIVLTIYVTKNTKSTIKSQLLTHHSWFSHLKHLFLFLLTSPSFLVDFAFFLRRLRPNLIKSRYAHLSNSQCFCLNTKP